MSDENDKAIEGTATDTATDTVVKTEPTVEAEVNAATITEGNAEPPAEEEGGREGDDQEVDITAAKAGSPMEEPDPAAKAIKDAAQNRTAQTIGERRVRTNFNVAQGAGALAIDEIKAISALLIDKVNALPNNGPESGRLKSLAMTKYEEAAMWAVKTATS